MAIKVKIEACNISATNEDNAVSLDLLGEIEDKIKTKLNNGYDLIGTVTSSQILLLIFKKVE